MIDVKNVNELLKYKESLEKDLGYKQINNNIDNNVNDRPIYWGNIYYAELDGQGSEQKGIRPVVIIQNNIGNRFSPTVVIATITSKLGKSNNVPTHVTIEGYGLKSKSIIEAEQIKTIDKNRLKSYVGRIDDVITINKIKKAIDISTSENLDPLDRIKDEDVREIIEDKLDKVRSYEIILSNSENLDFINHCLHNRQLELDELQDFCKENGLSYKNYYIEYKPKVDREINVG